jgi:NAD(P)H-dependent FMN reductase
MSRTGVFRIFAISGSLRRASSNGALVEAAGRLTPPDIEVFVYRDIGSIPPFNPDLDTAAPPEAVRALRSALGEADAILISSPEYAHGVPGALKNALDWVVGSGELIDKPIALINASARATHAYASLRETLTTMSARVIDEASITVPLDGTGLDATGIVNDVRLSAMLSAAVVALVERAR